MIKTLLILIAGFVLFIAAIGFVFIAGSGSREKSWAKTPGKMEFDNINSQITGYHGNDSLGNSEVGRKIGKAFSTSLSEIRDAAFTDGDKNSFSLSAGHFVTYCHESDKAILIICHVPQLRKFTDDAKGALMQYAWKVAQKSVTDNVIDYKGKVYVGLRGMALYYEFWSGSAAGGLVTKYSPEKGRPEVYKIFIRDTPEVKK